MLLDDDSNELSMNQKHMDLGVLSWRGLEGDKEGMVRMFFRCTAGLLQSQTFQGTTTAIFLPSVLRSTLWTVMRVSTSSSS